MPHKEEAMTRIHIIVGLDDSPSGRAALRWAAQHALLASSVLRAIHVLDWPYSSATPGVDMAPATMDEIESAYRTNITNVFQEIDPRPDWSMEFLRGEPGPVLVRKAKDAQLLVIGTREHVGIGRLLVGSISHYCLSHASCPVVAVPAEAFNAPGADSDPADHVGAPGQADAS
jgi:nucleotide-binding universal stress UspA family protein